MQQQLSLQSPTNNDVKNEVFIDSLFFVIENNQHKSGKMYREIPLIQISFYNNWKLKKNICKVKDHYLFSYNNN